MHGEGDCCLAPYGITGTAARFIEVETGGRVERAPLESPIGAWIAAWEPASTATVRILGEGDALLYSESYAPWPLYASWRGLARPGRRPLPVRYTYRSQIRGAS